jgi:hypothetical protein
MKTMFNMMKVERINMKIFPTHQWLGTWVYENIINSKIKVSNNWGIAPKNIEKKPHQLFWEGGESLKRK